MSAIRTVWYLSAVALVALLCTACVLLLLARAVNGVARWNALRHAPASASVVEASAESTPTGNVIVIGVKDGAATGFLALKTDSADKKIVGIAISGGTFLEVPGQGFSQVGDAYSSETTGAVLAMATIANYLSVPFEAYVAVSSEAYTKAVQQQSVAGLTDSPVSTNLSAGDLATLSERLAATTQDGTAIVPLPVRPIKLGSQTYLEPQRDEVADLLKIWWGVDAAKNESMTRVILYNGSGAPGIAGVAAQQLIRAGFRVVDTKNADSFDYTTTQVIVQSGKLTQGDAVAKALGVGEVKNQPADQDVAQIIVIIGKDYVAPAQ